MLDAPSPNDAIKQSIGVSVTNWTAQVMVLHTDTQSYQSLNLPMRCDRRKSSAMGTRKVVVVVVVVGHYKYSISELIN